MWFAAFSIVSGGHDGSRRSARPDVRLHPALAVEMPDVSAPVALLEA